MAVLTLCLPPARWGLRPLDSPCSGNFAICRWTSSNFIKTHLYRCNRHLTLKCQNSPLVSHLLAENQGPLIWSVVAILPDFDGFLKMSFKLDYLYRFRSNRTPTLSVLTVCLPPARWGPRALDSQCRCNIAWFRWISYFAKTRPFIQI